MSMGTLRSMQTPAAPIITDPEPWIEQAACRDHDPRLWDTFGGSMSQENQRALTICRTCPVRDLCRDFADRTEQPSVAFNIFGGETPAQRVARRRKTTAACSDCGRPRRYSKYLVVRSSGLCVRCWKQAHSTQWNAFAQKAVAA